MDRKYLESEEKCRSCGDITSLAGQVSQLLGIKIAPEDTLSYLRNFVWGNADDLDDSYATAVTDGEDVAVLRYSEERGVDMDKAMSQDLSQCTQRYDLAEFVMDREPDVSHWSDSFIYELIERDDRKTIELIMTGYGPISNQLFEMVGHTAARHGRIGLIDAYRCGRELTEANCAPYVVTAADAGNIDFIKQLASRFSTPK